MTYFFLFLLFCVGLVSSMPMLTLDPIIIDHKPVNNAQFPYQTSDLYGTNIVGHYKWISKESSYKRDVFAENFNDLNITNILFCPRTHQNPFMALYIKNSTNHRFVCKEKFATFPIRLFCELNFSRFHKCSNLYADTKFLKNNKAIVQPTTFTSTKNDDLKIKATTTNDDPSFVSADLNMLFHNPFVLFIGFCILIFACLFICCLFILALMVVLKRLSAHKTPPPFSVYPHYSPNPYAENRALRNG